MRKRIAAMTFSLLMLFSSATLAETILWEDENGQLILGDDGELEFIGPGEEYVEEEDLLAKADMIEETFTPEPSGTPAPFYTATPVPTAAPLPGPGKTLQYGDSGEYVLSAQERLTALGYYHGKCSGNYLEGTQSAVRRFQKYNGLRETGKLDTNTWSVLFSDAAIHRDGSVPYATPSPQPTPTPLPTPAPTPQPFTYTRKLQYGDSGELVSRLQSRLLDLGFYEAKVSGGYYKITRSAVRAFQEHNGLAVDGIAGRETQELLFSSEAVPASATPRPSPAPTPAKYTLMVDVANQLVSAYTYDENGEYTILVREMICSTGTDKNPTPLGTTIMPAKRARWGYFPTWGSHAQYLTRIDSANAFHSVLYSQPNERTLAVSSFEALGKQASHGCVRLLVSDAKWIYDNCEAGTIITVFEGEYDPEYTMSLKPTLNKSTLRENPLPEPTPTPVYAPQNWPTEYRTLSRGKSGEDVFMLQMRLKELGYYTGTVTGGYYGGTINAVKAFQKDHGLSVDGAAGKQTQSLLFSSAVDPTPVPGQENAVLDTPLPPDTPVPAQTPEPAPPAPLVESVG